MGLDDILLTSDLAYSYPSGLATGTNLKLNSSIHWGSLFTSSLIRKVATAGAIHSRAWIPLKQGECNFKMRESWFAYVVSYQPQQRWWEHWRQHCWSQGPSCPCSHRSFQCCWWRLHSPHWQSPPRRCWYQRGCSSRSSRWHNGGWGPWPSCW